MTLYDPDRPRLLDLFCGAGGAAMGYWRAGFQPIGVDIVKQPRYPFPFVQGDALNPPFDLSTFDAIHASPPCQGYSRMRHLPWLRHKTYPLLIEPTREMLRWAGVPYVIENVEDAPLVRAPTLEGQFGVWFCGTMFGLPLYRHRVFETSFAVGQPSHGRHQEVIHHGRLLNSRYSKTGGTVGVFPVVPVAGHSKGVMNVAPAAMGIDWMDRHSITQAIPPVMTEFLGAQLMEHLTRTAVP